MSQVPPYGFGPGFCPPLVVARQWEREGERKVSGGVGFHRKDVVDQKKKTSLPKATPCVFRPQERNKRKWPIIPIPLVRFSPFLDHLASQQKFGSWRANYPFCLYFSFFLHEENKWHFCCFLGNRRNGPWLQWRKRIISSADDTHPARLHDRQVTQPESVWRIQTKQEEEKDRFYWFRRQGNATVVLLFSLLEERIRQHPLLPKSLKRSQSIENTFVCQSASAKKKREKNHYVATLPHPSFRAWTTLSFPTLAYPTFFSGKSFFSHTQKKKVEQTPQSQFDWLTEQNINSDDFEYLLPLFFLPLLVCQIACLRSIGLLIGPFFVLINDASLLRAAALRFH